MIIRHGGATEYCLLWWDHVIPSGDSDTAASILKSLRSEPTAMGALRTLFEQRGGPRRADDEVVLAAVAELVRSGSVILGRRMFTGKVTDLQQAEQVAQAARQAQRTQQPVAATEKTWIEVEVVDELGNPMANLKYALKLADGSERTGVLDSQGRVRASGIDPGQCTFSLVEADGREWS